MVHMNRFLLFCSQTHHSSCLCHFRRRNWILVACCWLQVSFVSVQSFVSSGHYRLPTTRTSQLDLRLSSTSLTSSNSPDETNENDNNDTEKWERMYAQGQERRQGIIVARSESTLDTARTATPIRVLSLDLDNCLWKTSAVINGANDALAEQLERDGIVQPLRTEIVMKELFQTAAGNKYAPPIAKAPVQLTQLRKDAIQEILQEYNGYEEEQAKQKAAEYFEIWTAARHEAIPQNLAKDTIQTLQRIRQELSSDSQQVLMGAITDGNSDPSRIQALEPFFDFVVNAESVGVGKPDPAIYKSAMEQVVSTIQHENDSRYTISTEDQVGSWWVHVGDDFIKDIVAAKGMGMRTIWTREFVKKKQANEPAKEQQKTSKSVQDFVQQVSSMKVVTMQVGAEDYLAESLQDEFADAVVDSFADLADILTDWHTQGLRAQEIATDNSVSPPPDTADTLQVFYPDKGSNSPQPSKAQESTDAVVATKFCVDCGERLPKEAKFCSSCGKPQGTSD